MSESSDLLLASNHELYYSFMQEVIKPLSAYLNMLADGLPDATISRIPDNITISKDLFFMESAVLRIHTKDGLLSTSFKNAVAKPLGVITIPEKHNPLLKLLYAELDQISEYKSRYVNRHLPVYLVTIPKLDHPVNQFLIHSPAILIESVVHEIVDKYIEQSRYTTHLLVYVPLAFMALLAVGLIFALITQ